MTERPNFDKDKVLMTRQDLISVRRAILSLWKGLDGVASDLPVELNGDVDIVRRQANSLLCQIDRLLGWTKRSRS